MCFRRIFAVVVVMLGMGSSSVQALSQLVDISSVNLSALSLLSMTGEACGGPLDNVCATGEFCEFPPGSCNDATVMGICQVTGGACVTLWDPVCGCDGNTYGNSCVASASGVSIDFNGECPVGCAGIAGIPCGAGEFCKLNVGECCCDFQGVCTPLPQACIDVWEPVCGCDGQTYGNSCEADAAGASIDRVGSCVTDCSDAANNPCVTVIVDMDAVTPGIQRNIDVPIGTTIVHDVAVYVFDTSASHSIWGIGFVGGVDRGIGLGHSPDSTIAVGRIVSMQSATHTPANPNATAWLMESPLLDPAFSGVEVQYLESSTQPSSLPTAPIDPIFVTDIRLENATQGDVYNFYMVDFVAIWSGGNNGAFSTQGLNALDTGGDAVRDGTTTLNGIDLDTNMSLLSSAFAVDFVDGGNEGPATITVTNEVIEAIPASSTWGVICMALVMLTCGTLVIQRKTCA